jgi:asparagine synthase (glutamine-hydrolysing)
MCGIAGLIQKFPNPAIRDTFIATAQGALRKRGPDAQTAASYHDHVTLIHTRLAIIDIKGGTQPLADDQGAIVLNGEIYNHADLRHPADIYKTHSDTEVLLKGLHRQGTDFLPQADGMFAFAQYDFATRTLMLARDRFGIKPLYIYQDDEVFAFSSTLAPLMLFSKRRINTQALQDYYLFRAARAPHTIFEDIQELDAGQYLQFDVGKFMLHRPKRWLPAFAPSRHITKESEALELLDAAMKTAIKRHLVSDVPVGTFLSGGVDSSLITALAAHHNPDLSAFTLGFTDAQFDESDYANSVCKHLNIHHNVLRADSRIFMDVFEKWASLQDDVVADPSALMLYKISEHARDAGYKVLLSGEGADELFAGYNQHFRFSLATRFAPLGKHLSIVPKILHTVTPEKTRRLQYAHQMTDAREFHGTGMIFEPYLASTLFSNAVMPHPTAHTLSDALLHDQQYRLPNDLLTRTDRATMGASIEARVPFLCAGVQDAANSISTDLLLKGRLQKALLKKYAERYVPKDCLYRPKVGFDLPLAHWLRGTMKPLVQDTLASTWQTDYFNKDVLDTVLNDHFTHRNNNADKIFAFLLLERNVHYLRSLPSLQQNGVMLLKQIA